VTGGGGTIRRRPWNATGPAAAGKTWRVEVPLWIISGSVNAIPTRNSGLLILSIVNHLWCRGRKYCHRPLCIQSRRNTSNRGLKHSLYHRPMWGPTRSSRVVALATDAVIITTWIRPGDGLCAPYYSSLCKSLHTRSNVVLRSGVRTVPNATIVSQVRELRSHKVQRPVPALVRRADGPPPSRSPRYGVFKCIATGVFRSFGRFVRRGVLRPVSTVLKCGDVCHVTARWVVPRPR